jgi:hypothetical protein
VSVRVEAGRPVILDAPGQGVAVTAEGDALDPGTLSIAAAAGVPAPSHGGPPVSITSTGAVRGWLTVRFTLPDGADPDTAAATWDEARRVWLPVEGTRDGRVLTFETPHLTVFDWIGSCLRFDDPDNACARSLGYLGGSRAQRPDCGGAHPPKWVSGSNTENNSISQQLYVCLGTAGENLAVRAVNNRGFAVALQLKTEATLAKVAADWPDGLADLVARIFAVAGDNTSLLLPPTGTGNLEFAPPQRNDQILGYVRQTPTSMLVTALAEAVLAVNPDVLPLSNGTKLTAAMAECANGLLKTSADLFRGDLSKPAEVGAVIGKVLACVGAAVDLELKRLKQQKQPPKGVVDGLDRIKNKLWLLQHIKYVDLLLDKRRDIDDSPDISVNVDLGPVPVGFDRIGPFVIGMTVADVRAAAGVALDKDDYCGFFTFHGEQSFGRGDGPTFFFDEGGRLRGMLLGRSVFHRAPRTDKGARFGSTLAELQQLYGAALVPPGQAESPDLAWVRGPSGTAIGFEVDGGTVQGMRVGPENFVTVIEYCG